MKEEKKEYIDIWGDNVKISDVVLSVSISIGLAIGGYMVAPNEDPKPLIFGLVGSVLGFLISSIIIKPKRNLTRF